MFDAADRLERTHELGRAIRRKVAEAAPDPPPQALLFVNAHSEELSDNELLSVDAPLSTLAERVVLEITERSALHTVPAIRTRLTKLRKLGYRIAVDDLGAGYAGLASISELEPDFVKLDMSLIRDADKSPQKRSLVKAIAQACKRDLGIQVVCEGLERPEERATLASNGLDLFQGYLFARPARGFPTPAW